MNFTSSKIFLDRLRIVNINQLIYDTFIVFNSLICGEVIGILGIVGNVINIVNFYRQGLSDSITVSLMALAVSDIGALVTLQGWNIIISPWLTRAEIDVSIFDVMAVFLFYPHGYFMRVGGLVTTFAAIERCASVICPLKVKVIFTRKMALMVNVTIFVSLSAYLVPIYYVMEFGYMTLPGTNRSIYTATKRSNADYVLQVSYLLTDLTLPFLTFIVNIICTMVITVQLKVKAKWRSSVSTVGQDGTENGLSSRQTRMTVMLVTVSVIFVVCLAPHSFMLAAVSTDRELKVGGARFDIAMVCYSFTLLLETINCSVSILVYYNMSSRYRAIAQDMVSCLVKPLTQ